MISSTWRIRALSFCLVVCAGFFLFRLFYLQAIRGDDYADMADHQYVSPTAALYDRGSIYFTSKNKSLVAAASLKRGYTLAIDPNRVKNPEMVFSSLRTHIPLDREEFMTKAGKKGDSYEELATRVESVVADKIVALKLPGVSLYKDRWRYYPAGNLASQVVGFLGYDKDDNYTGRSGLEMYYNDVLSREETNKFSSFFTAFFSDLGRSLIEEGQAFGAEGDLVLTIEPVVQTALEKELLSLKDRWSAKSVGGIIADPFTGEIIAMGALPNFDPGKRISDIALLKNPLVENVYEMGSIVKALTMAAGLDSGAVTPQTTYNDLGSITLNNKTIWNFDQKARGVVPMQEVLNQSLNTGATFVMQEMGRDKFRNYFKKFGFGEKTGVDLPGEVSGLVSSFDSTKDVDYATASFGQGFAATPIQMIRALSALANGGQLVRPRVVKAINYETTVDKVFEPEVGRQVISPESSKMITKMLVRVVDEKLAGGTVKLPRYQIAAKTGTAQIPKPGGGYYDDRYLHTFFGYGPASKAKFLVFLYVLEPQGVSYASETLTQPFTNLTKFMINYYELPPDR